MKAIKKVLFVCFIIFIFSCEDENIKRLTGENIAFVRFFLLTDNNNKVLEFPDKDGNALAKTSYDKDNLKTLKIPVTITAPKIDDTIEVTFDKEVTGITNYTITPANTLSFTNEKRIDTIYIKLNERWDLTQNPQIKLNLTSVSDANIALGTPNNEISNKELTINFKETEFTFLFDLNRKEIQGIKDETFDFNIIFPNGFITSDIKNLDLFSTPNTFDYLITKKPITKEDEVSFSLTINENIAEDVALDVFLKLLDIPNYTKGVNKSLQINKPIKIEREGNPAANFYDLQTANYRLRGERWRPDTDNPGSCEWFPTNVFAVPVIVDKNDPNGIFISNNGTLNDESDDIYHHKYKIGMVSPIQGRSTNPFALKNILKGASSDNSPGFNITEAVEFFPKNGNSETEGTMSVISQNLTITRLSDGKTFSIPISGVGTYKIVDTTSNTWQMEFEITYDLSEVNGTILTLPMFYNSLPGQPEPAMVNNQCYEEIQL